MVRLGMGQDSYNGHATLVARDILSNSFVQFVHNAKALARCSSVGVGLSGCRQVEMARCNSTGMPTSMAIAIYDRAIVANVAVVIRCGLRQQLHQFAS
jgi:hypothetical protein